jgi:hypothetical protein
VQIITAFLFHNGGDDDPQELIGNADKSYQGSIILGMGFSFDDTDTKGITNPIALMNELVRKDPRNGERIFPLIGGEEVTSNADPKHYRYVIDFFNRPLGRRAGLKSWDAMNDGERNACLTRGLVPEDYPDEVAEDWPDLISLIRDKVKPDRDRQTRPALRERWWQYAEKRPGLYRSIEHLDRVLVNSSKATPHHAFVFLPTGRVYSQNLNVFVFDSNSAFAALSNRVHELWARFFGTTFKDDLTYTVEDCFRTFPFPLGFERDEALDQAGRIYHSFRAELMLDTGQGTTELYNRFHDPEERSNAIGELRRRHDAMDRVVLDAYGWTDILPTCDFELEWEDDEEGANGRRRRKPWRYRWPEPVRDEVLARLLALNAQRAEEERLAGLT